MDNRLAVGVDLGGTKIAFALIDVTGTIIETHQMLTNVADGPESVMDRIAEGIQLSMEAARQPVAGIGIGSPGHIDPVRGVVRYATNLGWSEVHLVQGVKERLSSETPIWLQKDTNAAVLGEMYYGAARGCKDVVLIAIGTGLGVGAVVDGCIVMGANTDATDIGHLTLDLNGRLCACGLRGCIETYVSGNGLLAGVREHRAEYPQSKLVGEAIPSTA